MRVMKKWASLKKKQQRQEGEDQVTAKETQTWRRFKNLFSTSSSGKWKRVEIILQEEIVDGVVYKVMYVVEALVLVSPAKKTLAVLNEKILEPTNGIGAAETVQIRSTREKEKQEVMKLVSCGTEDQVAVVTKPVKLEIFNKLRSLHGMQGQED